MSASLTQPYATIYFFARTHGINFSKSEGFWRLTDRLVGQINGLPGSRGVLTATDGILCYIEQERDGRVELFAGHIQWFIADSGESSDRIVEKATKPRTEKEQRTINILNAYE